MANDDTGGATEKVARASRRGRFISLEGPEGSGKSTQARLLAAWLQDRGYPVMALREPGGTPLGESIRGLLQHDAGGEAPTPAAETLLFEASRAQLAERVIAPALAAGKIVVCDRYADSTTAYQGYGRGFDIDRILMLHDFAVQGSYPDLTLLVDVPIDLGFARLRERSRQSGLVFDRMEREDKVFHERVRNGFLDLAARFPERIVVVDGCACHATVTARIRQAVIALLARDSAPAPEEQRGDG